MASEQEISIVTNKVKEYAELSKTIRIAQEKVKVLNKKKKALYQELVPKLKNTNIEKCNLAFGTLKVVETKRKILPTRANLKDRYQDFFRSRSHEQDFVTGNPEQKAEILFNFIYNESIEYKKEQSISMVYSKEFRDQLKDLNIS
jgi:hypothetical protein